MKVEEARAIDFTGQIPGFRQFKEFDDTVVRFLRNGDACHSLVVVDWGRGMEGHDPAIVGDHLNLTGWSPLVGPNDPVGPRFPVVNDVYDTDFRSGERKAPRLKQVVVAGLKNGVKPSDADVKLIKSLGADVYCYNVVPTMITAAHAGLKVLAILVPEGAKPSDELVSLLTDDE